MPRSTPSSSSSVPLRQSTSLSRHGLSVTRPRLTRFSFRPLPPQASPRAPPPLFQISSSLRSAASSSSVCLAEKGVLVRSLPLSPPFLTQPIAISTLEPRRTNSSTLSLLPLAICAFLYLPLKGAFLSSPLSSFPVSVRKLTLFLSSPSLATEGSSTIHPLRQPSISR